MCLERFELVLLSGELPGEVLDGVFALVEELLGLGEALGLGGKLAFESAVAGGGVLYLAFGVMEGFEVAFGGAVGLGE